MHMADAKWDGMERRVTADRRKGQQIAHQEYPKMVDGVVHQNADQEAAGEKALKEAQDAEAPPAKRKPYALSAEDADGTAARMAKPGDFVPGDQTALHPAVGSTAATTNDKAKPSARDTGPESRKVTDRGKSAERGKSSKASSGARRK